MRDSFCIRFPHTNLESRHVGGLQSLLQSLAEEVVADRGPCRHWGDAAGGVGLQHRQNDRQKLNSDHMPPAFGVFISWILSFSDMCI